MAEVISCPSCQRKVSIPTEYFGKQVQCPECKQTFVAQDPAGEQYQPRPPTPKQETFAPPRSEDSWEDRDAPRRRRRSRDGSYDDDDLAFGRSAIPHRGGAVLTLGILSIVLCGPIFGPIAWVMGAGDMKQIRAGQMDRSGEGVTQAGLVCGIIGTILGAVEVVLGCLWFIAFSAAMGHM